MFMLAFWIAALERAIRTAAQTLLAGGFFSDVGPVNAFELDWKLAAGLAAGGAVSSLLTSIVASGVSSGPSFAPKAEVDSALAPLTDDDRGEVSLGTIAIVIVVVLAAVFVLKELGWLS